MILKGMAAPLTGPDADTGLAIESGAKLAVEEINKAGGVQMKDKYFKIDHAFGYDALYNSVECLSKAGSVQPEEIVKALAQLDRQGILSRLSLLHVWCNRVQRR